MSQMMTPTICLGKGYVYCWFARDVMVAMLLVKNKTISVLWEINSIFMSILWSNVYSIDQQQGHHVSWLQTKNI